MIISHFFLVSFAWIFFRAENFHVAGQMINKLMQHDFSLNMSQLSAGKGPLNLVLSFVVIFILGLSYLLPRDLKLRYNLLFMFCVTFLILILGRDVKSEFIYFQF